MKNAGFKLVAIVFIGSGCFVAGQMFSRHTGSEPETVESITATAQGALHNKNYAVAIEQFTRALAINPNDAALHGNLGLALTGSGRTQEALSEFEECVRLDPARLDIAKQLGMGLFKFERFKEAKNRFETVVSKRPDDAEAYQWLFTINNRLDYQLENLPVLERLVELRPDETRYVYAQVMIYHQEDQVDDALRTFETLPAAERETNKARYVLASIYFKRQDYPKAIELLEQVVSDDPEHAKAQKLLEDAHSQAEQARKFENEFARINEAIEASPEDTEFRFRLGLALIKAGRPDEATTAFQECLSRLDPEKTDAAKRLSKSLYALELFDLAEQYLELVADKAEDLEVYELLLAISTRRNRPLENLPILEKMAALRPEETKYIAWQLGIYLENNQPEGALKALKNLPTEQQEQVKNQYILGVIYYQLNEFSKAVDVLENVVLMAPENADAQKILDLCRSKSR